MNKNKLLEIAKGMPETFTPIDLLVRICKSLDNELNKSKRALQYITDEAGKVTHVIVPMEDWLTISRTSELPQWVKDQLNNTPD